jgi:formate/nitrite transporter FocA (FNT family)
VDARLFPGKQFISTILDVLDSKAEMTRSVHRIYLMRAGMAGILIGVFYMGSYAVIGAMDSIPAGDTTLEPMGKILGAVVFGWALVFIYYTGSELLTSNMMVGTVGLYHRRASVGRFGKLLGLCYLGNVLGGLFVAVLAVSSSLLTGSTGEVMGHSVEVKTGYITQGVSGWSDLLVRAILCNFLINVAMLLCYNGRIKEDIMKAFAMVVAVFLFAFMGLEHSVANSVLFMMYGLAYGVDVLPALLNVAIALIGNFIGGGLLIGWYYAYANDQRRAEARRAR